MGIIKERQKESPRFRSIFALQHVLCFKKRFKDRSTGVELSWVAIQVSLEVVSRKDVNRSLMGIISNQLWSHRDLGLNSVFLTPCPITHTHARTRPCVTMVCEAEFSKSDPMCSLSPLNNKIARVGSPRLSRRIGLQCSPHRRREIATSTGFPVPQILSTRPSYVTTAHS